MTYRGSRRHQSTISTSTTTPTTTTTTTTDTDRSAEEAASWLLSRFEGKTLTARQVLDGNQLQKLSLTLGRRSLHPGAEPDITTRAPPAGTPIPPGYHLAYFTPSGVEAELGADGSDGAFNAPPPFTRRMWAGGRMRWAEAEGEGAGAALRVGDEVEERTTLRSAVAKVGRDGAAMVLVGAVKEFWGPGGLAVVDERSWIFRPKATSASPAAELRLRDAVVTGPSTVKDILSQEGSYPRRQFRWSPTGLFRFSALTFNGHKIHYDPTWTASVEGHPACVVHGPLNLINMLDYWRDHCGVGGLRVKEINYRAVAPLYAGDTYEISAEGPTAVEGTDGNLGWDVVVTKDGRTHMKGHILGM
ncbi:putative mesaconyl-c4 hydratase [Rosellinia necatrix]|uniref:Putative mesaconyl-c4 hydratase n=1 Tax=Rosellinia necatrix TaxID=77044 RepID=A0A1W2TQZ3_ROSNE|nr:putative mesaconyl-c4 hydratase [Rosellinia necatrix]